MPVYREANNIAALEVPQTRWTVTAGSQRYTAAQESDLLSVQATVTNKLPADHTVELGVYQGGWKYYPLDAKGDTKYGKEFSLSSLGLKHGSTYRMRTMLSSWGVESDWTGDSYVAIPLPQVKVAEPYTDPNQGYIDYGCSHATFDTTPDGAYSFLSMDEAVKDVDHWGVTTWRVYDNLHEITRDTFFDITNSLGITHRELEDILFTTEPWERKAAFAEVIREMINEEAYKEQLAANIAENVSTLNSVRELLGIPGKYKVSTATGKQELTALLNVKYKAALDALAANTSSKAAQSALGLLKHADKALKGMGYADMALGHVVIWISAYQTNEEYIEALKLIGSNAKTNEPLSEAIADVVSKYEQNPDGFANAVKKEQSKELLIDQIVSTVVNGTLSVAFGGVVGITKGVLDAALNLGGINKKMEHIDKAIMDGYIQMYAGYAYADYRTRTGTAAGRNIRSAGIVYLLAARYANDNFAEFLSRYDWKSEAGKARFAALKKKVEEIGAALPIWMNEHRLPGAFESGGGGTSTGGF